MNYKFIIFNPCNTTDILDIILIISNILVVLYGLNIINLL